MKKLIAVTVDAVERELYFNKQKTKHEKCFIKHICERWVKPPLVFAFSPLNYNLVKLYKLKEEF